MSLVQAEEMCIHWIIQRQARSTPDAVAVTSTAGKRSDITYAQLDARADRLAQRLIQEGVGPESLVGVYFEKSTIAIIAMLAAIKAGGAYMPLDPSHPVGRVAGIVEDAGAKIIVAQDTVADKLATVGNDVRIVVLSHEFEQQLPDVVGDMGTAVQPHNRAFTMWTSGSTGNPKGIVMEHRAFCTSAKYHAKALDICSTSRVFQFASYTYDVSIGEVFTTLMHGGTICVPTEQERMNRLAECICAMDANWMFLTPTVANLLRPKDVPCLRTLVLGGEHATPENFAVWGLALNLINSYGPAETAIWSHCRTNVQKGWDAACIGNRIGICDLRIVDQDNHNTLVREGEIGELLIGGHTLARGYLNDPVKTAAAFIEAPRWAYPDASPTPSSPRFYRTGDLAKVQADGTYQIHGRTDFQVKVRGQRVELGEVELHLAHGCIENALACLPKTGPYRGRLTAVIAFHQAGGRLASTSPLSILEDTEDTRQKLQVIRQTMLERLPSYMNPSAFIPVFSIPKLTSGKMNRREVLDWVSQLERGDVQLVNQMARQDSDAKSPSCEWSDTQSAKALQAAVTSVLNIPAHSVEAQRSFISLGGDSISAMQVMAILRPSGLAVTAQSLLLNQPLGQACSSITTSKVVYAEADDYAPFGLTPIQRMHFTFAPHGDPENTQAVNLQLKRSINPDAVQGALRTLVQRHPMLRARFDRREGRWTQRIIDDAVNSFSFRTHPYDINPATTLNIHQGPLLSAELNGDLLHIAIHHLVIDLVSWRVILYELERCLSDASLPPLASLSFQSWSKLQNGYAAELQQQAVYQGPKFKPETEFWGLRHASNNYRGIVKSVVNIDSKSTSALFDPKCHAAMATEPVDLLLSALIASFAATFGSHRGPPSLYNEGHGRDPWSSEMENVAQTVGWFTTMSPIYLSQANSQSRVEILREVKDLRKSFAANGFQHFTDKWINQASGAHADAQSMEILFNYSGRYQQLEREDSLFKLASPVLESGGLNMQRLAFFEITAVVNGDQMQVEFQFHSGMKHRELIHSWIESYGTVLRELIGDASKTDRQFTKSDFPLLQMEYLELKQLQKLIELMDGISLNDVEDIYPCSPMQQAILVSQARDSSLYAVKEYWQVSGQGSRGVDVNELAVAWGRVVAQHPLLRTVFLGGEKDGPVQVVMRSLAHEIQILDEVVPKSDALAYLQARPSAEHKLTHRLTLLRTGEHSALCKLEISHAVIDGASVAILIRDFARCYRSSPSRALTAKPSLYNLYVRQLLSQDTRAAEEFWSTYLKSVQPTYWASRRPAPERGDRSLNITKLNIATQLDALRSFCAQTGSTISNIMQAAWALVLNTYLNQTDPSFGYLVSGRDAPIPGIDDAVGPFINMLVRNVHFSEAGTVRELLGQMHDDYMASLPHQHYSLARIHELLKMGRRALFNTVVTYQRRTVYPEESSELAVKEVAITDPTDFDFVLDVLQTETDISVTALSWHLADEEVCDIEAAFNVQLQNIIQCYESPVSSLNLLSSRDVAALVETTRHLPTQTDTCMHELFEQTCADDPQKAAIVSRNGEMSYHELNAMADELGRRVHQLLGAHEKPVVLFFENSPCAIIAMFAVLKSGNYFVALDPQQPEARLKMLAAQTGAKLALTSPASAKLWEALKLTESQITVEPRDLQDPITTQEPLPTSSVSPSALAYCIFTSGTTGTPKGVLIEHGAASTSILGHGAAMGYERSSRVVQYAAYTWDASIGEIFTTLAFGGTICSITGSERVNDIAGAIRNLKANFLFITPSVLNLLEFGSCPSLKTLHVGGEPSDLQVIKKWQTQAHVSQVYGPTECCVICFHHDHPLELTSYDIACIGRSSSAVAWVVDPNDHTRLVPRGAIGELLIEGRLLARGYLNNDKATDSAFISENRWAHQELYGPVLRTPRRLYKTGDLVRQDLSGDLHILGRKDGQVKIHGQRCELEEIEQALRKRLPDSYKIAIERRVVDETQRHLDILTAFVDMGYLAGTKDSHQAATTVALASLAADRDLLDTVRTATALLEQDTPGYMVPRYFVPVSRLPLKTTGKIDRVALLQLASGISSEDFTRFSITATSKSPPTNAVEKQLHSLWARSLGVDPNAVGIDDNFFTLGGDSLKAMSLGRLAGTKGLFLKVMQIITYPTIRGMAQLFNQNQHEESAVVDTVLEANEPITASSEPLKGMNLCGLSSDQIDDMYPATSFQEGLISLSMKTPGAYMFQEAYRIKDKVNQEEFSKALDTVIERHAVLRTRFLQPPNERIYQVVLAHSPGQAIQKTSAALEVFLSQDPVCVEFGGELSRIQLVTCDADGETYLVWSIHHSLYDGWSLGSIWDEIFMVYNDMQPVRRTPYKNFVEHVVHAEAQEDSKNYWNRHLEGFDSIEFPTLPHPDYIPSPTLEEQFHLQSAAKVDGVTQATLLNAAWVFTSALYASCDDVVIGLNSMGRDDANGGLDQVIGPTLSTMPLRVDLGPFRSRPAIDFLQHIQSTVAESNDHQHYGLRNMRSLGKLARQACGFQSNILIHPPGQRPMFNATLVEPVNVSKSTAFDTIAVVLQCFMPRKNAKSMSVLTRYDPQVVPTPQLHRMMKTFEHVLTSMAEAANAATLLSGVSILSPSDHSDILRWNAHRAPARNVCLHSLIEKQTRARPGGLAIFAHDGQLSYAQFWKQSINLAKHLVLAGVRPDDFVLVCMEKSVFAPVSMLAIMIAGAAYVPLDPANPVGRLQTIRDGCGASVVLTSLQCADAVNGLDTRVMIVDKNLVSANDVPKGIQLPVVSPSSAAFCIFSSGSTGTPKGIVVEHRSICTSFSCTAPVFGFDSASRVLQFAAHTFDVSIQDIFEPLTVGGCVCIPSDSERLSDLAGVMERMGVNWTFLTPTVASLLAPSNVPSLRTLVLGGEAITKDNMHTWANGQVRVINSFGPAEASICCGLNVLNEGNGRATDLSTLNRNNFGHGLGSRHWIADPADPNKLFPIGCVGELLLDGETLARGYINDPVKTGEAFLPGTAWSEGHRVYRTGDLVRYAADGTKIFVGRRDGMIKLHGQRIELGEIEYHVRNALTEMRPDIKFDVCALLVPIVAFEGRDHIAAFFAAASAATDASTDSIHLRTLRDALKMRLPPHMMPSLFVLMAALPKTSSQKLNREALTSHLRNAPLDLISQYSLTHEAEAAPRTGDMHSASGTKLRKLWSEVLRMQEECIGYHDSFFALGGDSILAMRLSSMASAHNTKLSVPQIFKHPLLSAMAECCEGLDETPEQELKAFGFHQDRLGEVLREAAEQCDIEERLIEDIYPATPLQEGLLALTATTPGSYVAVQRHRLPTSTNVGKFQAACTATVRALPILRTRIVMLEGFGCQQVVLRSTDPLKTVELSEVPKSTVEASQEFGFGTKLLDSWIEPEADYYTFVMCIHHALYDGWSLPKIYETFEAHFQGHSAPPTVPYRNFIAYTFSQPHDSAKTYWTEYLHGASRLSVPGYVTSDEGARRLNCQTHTFRKDRSEHATWAVVLRAAWAYVLSAHCSSQDIVFAETLSGRNVQVPSIINVVGSTLATVPVRVQMDQATACRELLNTLQQQSIRMMSFEQTGLRTIKACSPDAANACDFGASLTINQGDGTKQKEQLLRVHETDVDLASFWSYPLNLSCIIDSNSIQVRLIFDTSTLSRSDAQLMLRRLERVATGFASAPPDCKVGDVEKTTSQDAPSKRAPGQSRNSGLLATHVTVGEATIPQADLVDDLKRKISQIYSSLLPWTRSMTQDQIPDDQSFITMGGDSILAIRVSMQAKKAGFKLLPPDILRSPSISDLALKASKQLSSAQTQPNKGSSQITRDTCFSPTPMQELFFNRAPNGCNWFNQSCLFDVDSRFTASQILKAVEQVVEVHPMLRARYFKEEEQWRGRTLPFGPASFASRICRISSRSEMESVLRDTQKSISMTAGPVCAATVLEQGNTRQLYLVVHHLAMDIVSWEIVLADLQDALQDGIRPREASASHAQWQQELALQGSKQSAHLPGLSGHSDNYLDFWAMRGRDNRIGDTHRETFSISTDATNFLVSQKHHDMLGTEAIDILLGALAASFTHVFGERGVPAVYTESHGRDASFTGLDLSRTVGWFTAMHQVSVGSSDATMEERCRDVNACRQHLSGAVPQRFFAEVNAAKRSTVPPFEIMFNYAGFATLRSSTGAAIAPSSIESGIPDCSEDAPRFALIDVMARVIEGRLSFDIVYNKHMLHAERMADWAQQYIATLENFHHISSSSERIEPVPEVVSQEISRETSEELLLRGALSEEELTRIERLLPASPMQRAMLSSQVRDPSLYSVSQVFRLESKRPVAGRRLMQAWETVVKRHAALRTVFCETDKFGDDVGYMQVVLADASSRIEVIDCGSSRDDFENVPPRAPSSLHQLSVYQESPNKLLMRLEIPHTMIDGTSMSILLEELAQICSGDVSSLAQTSFDYGRFLDWQLNDDSGDDKAFWRDYMTGREASMFPQLGDPGIPDGGELQHLAIRLPNVTQQFQRLGVTSSTVLQVSWALVLATYTNKDTATFGIISSLRDPSFKGIEDAVGPFINTLPFHVSIDAYKGASMRKFLDSVSSGFLDCLVHQRLPLAEVFNLAGVRGGLFNTVLSVQSRAENLVSKTGFSFEQIHGYDPSEFAIVLNAASSANDLVINLQYRTSTLTTEAAHSLAETLQHTILQLVDNGEQEVRNLDLLCERQMNQIMDWNANYPEATFRCIHDLIIDRCHQRPAQLSRTALSGWDGEMTYEQLLQHADVVADEIRTVHSHARARIPILFEKSVFTVVAMLGILKSGNAFAPLDSQSPLERMRFIMQDLNAPLVLASRPNVHTARRLSDKPVLVVGPRRPSLVPVRNVQRTPSNATPDYAAYILYTSGSTGNPKGVIINHSSVSSLVQAYGSFVSLSEKTRMLQYAPYIFDAMVKEIFATLAFGGTVCVPHDSDRLENIASFVAENDVDIAFFAPSFAETLELDAMPSLKTVVLGGEMPRKRVVSTWAEKVRLINGYGPTEATVCSVIKDGMDPSAPSVTGRALGCRTWIVDPGNHDHLTPIGGVGELLIEGPNVGRGYLNNLEKTAEVFIERPTWTDSRQHYHRFYKTGDLARYLPNGELVVLGRKDDQVKLHGQRLEIGEVEQNMLSCKHVKNCLVTIPKNGQLANRLVAVVSLRSQGRGHQADMSVVQPSLETERMLQGVRNHLSGRLPHYMQPTTWFCVGMLPLNESGKLNRSKVKEWISSQTVSGAEVQASSATTTLKGNEAVLARIWAAALNFPVERIMSDKSFLSYGGDSITAIQAKAAAKRTGIPVTVHDLLSGKTIQAICQGWSKSVAPTSLPTATTVQAEAPSGTPFPLSAIQQLYLDISGTINNHFNQSFLMQLDQSVQPMQVQKGVNAILARHDMLRARLTRVDGSWMQVVPETLHDSAPVLSFHRVKDMAELNDIAARHQKQIDAVHGPVFQAALFFVRETDRQILLLLAHHFFVDFVSWRLIMSDLETVLSGNSLPDRIGELTFPSWLQNQRDFANTVKSQLDWAQSTLGQKPDLSYWGLSPHMNTSDNVRDISVELSEEDTTTLLASLSSSQRTRIADCLLGVAAFGFQQTFTDRECPTIFVEGHGRESWDPEIDPSEICGWFTTVSPVHVSRTTSLVDAVREAQHRRANLIRNGFDYFSARYLTDEGRRTFAAHNTMEVMFNYLGQLQQFKRADSLLRQVHDPRYVPDEVAPDQVRFALIEITASVVNDKLHLRFAFNERMKHVDKMHTWAQMYMDNLRSLARDQLPNAPESYRPSNDGPEDIEQVADCTDMQKFFLRAHLDNSLYYTVLLRYKVELHSSEGLVSGDRLAESWQKVVDKHQILRTALIPGGPSPSPARQVAYRRMKAQVQRLKGVTDEEAQEFHVEARQSLPLEGRLGITASIAETTSGQVYFTINIFHGLVDGSSIELLERDLTNAYHGLSIDDTRGFVDAAITLKSDDRASNLMAVSGSTSATPTSERSTGPNSPSLPSASDSTSSSLILPEGTLLPPDLESLDPLSISKPLPYPHKVLQYTDIPPISTSTLLSIGARNSCTSATVLQGLWALTISPFATLPQQHTVTTNFAAIGSGRHQTAIDRIETIVGPILQLSLRSVDMKTQMLLKDLFSQLQLQLIASFDDTEDNAAQALSPQHVHGKATSSTGLRTVFNFQRYVDVPASENLGERASGLKLTATKLYDPWNFDIHLSLQERDGFVNAQLQYWAPGVERAEAERLAGRFKRLAEVLGRENRVGTVGQLEERLAEGVV